MEKDMIRFVGDGKWLVIDVYRFFHFINVFYNRLYVFNKYYKEEFDKLLFNLQKSLYFISEGDELTIYRLVIASPSEFNLKGSGDILRELREFCKDYKYRWEVDKKLSELLLKEKEVDVQLKEEELKNRRIQGALSEMKLIEAKIELLKLAGYSIEEIKEIMVTLFNPAKKLIDIAEKQQIELKENDD